MQDAEATETFQSALRDLADLDLCKLATDRRGGEVIWAGFMARHVKEAKRRGFSPESCEKRLEVSEQGA